MNPDIAVWKQMSGSGIHVACVGLVFWLLVHREDESQDHKAVTKDFSPNQRYHKTSLSHIRLVVLGLR